MEKFDYYNPTKIIFGNGVRNELVSHLGGKYKKVLLTVGKKLRESIFYNEIKKDMEKSDIKVFDMSDISSNPLISNVREGVKVCKENSIECVIALGGGSTMDCSKVIAAGAKYDIDPYNFFWGDRIPIEEAIDIITIPTLAATGTEVNPTAVIVNDETKEKYFCESTSLFPKFALIDPEITLTAPLKLTIFGAMDILSHTFEFYFNGYTKSEFQNRFSEGILLSTMKVIEDIATNPKNLYARGELMWCALMAWGSGITKIGRGQPDMAVHAIEESTSGYFGTHHGGGCGVLTPRWMDVVSIDNPIIFARFARKVLNVDESNDSVAAAKGIEIYKNWIKMIGGPVTLFDLGNNEFSDKELEHVSKTAWKVYKGKIGRLKRLTLEEVNMILRNCRIPY